MESDETGAEGLWIENPLRNTKGLNEKSGEKQWLLPLLLY
jgi:hypothetical protein